MNVFLTEPPDQFELWNQGQKNRLPECAGEVDFHIGLMLITCQFMQVTSCNEIHLLPKRFRVLDCSPQ